MKFLFKVIFLPILISLALPVTFLALAYKSVSIPIEDFSSNGAVQLTDMINEQIDTFLLDNDQDSKIDIRFNQKQANGLLLTALRDQNEFYLSDNAPDDESKYYVMREDNYGVQGVWVRLNDETIEIEIGIHAFFQELTYKTRLLLVFELVADTSEIVLTLDKLSIGNLPLAWTFGVAGWATNLLSGFDVDEFVNNILDGRATFDLNKRELRLDVQKLIDEALKEDPDTHSLAKGLMSFLEENELMDIGVTEDGLGVAINFGKLNDPTEPYVLPEMLKIIDEIHFRSILTARASGVLFSTLDTQSGHPYIELDQLLLNRIFEYMLRNQLSPSGIIEESEVFENYVLRVLVPYVTMDENLIINLPIVFEKIGSPEHAFKTTLKLSATPSVVGQDLVIEVVDLTVGQVTMGGDDIQNILSLIGETSFIQDGKFVIKNFNLQFEQSGIEIVDVSMVNDKLRLSVSVNTPVDYVVIQEIINDVINDMTTILDGMSDDFDEVNDAFSQVINSITDENLDTAEAITQLLENIDQLDDTQQQELFDTLLIVFQGLDPEQYDLDENFNFEDLFDFFGN